MNKIGFTFAVYRYYAQEQRRSNIPKWTSFPTYTSVAGSQIKVQAAISVLGEISCIRDEVNKPMPSNLQVFMHFDYDNQDRPGVVTAVTEINKIFELTFEDLEVAKEYQIFCSSHNADPHWPATMSESLDAPSAQVVMVESVDTDDNFAGYLQVFLLWTLII